MNIAIRKITGNYPFDLLLLADETIEAIEKYLYDSDVYIAEDSTGMAIAVFCLYPVDVETIELKNIAVRANIQNQGIGSYLLRQMNEIAQKGGYRTVIVGTGDCGVGQIRFYERNGFIKYGVRENFFIENFPEPIYENGIMMKDMVMLKKEIGQIG